MKENEISVIITDSNGNTFSRNWLATANRLDAIRWTVASEDAPFCVDVAKIVSVTIKEKSVEVQSHSDQ